MELLFVLFAVCQLALGAVTTTNSSSDIQLKQCKNVPNLPIKFENISFKRFNSTVHELSGQIILDQPIKEGYNFKTITNGTLCNSDGGDDACETFSDNKTFDLCDYFVKDKDPVTVEFFKHIKVDKKCPIPKGIYVLKKFMVIDEPDFPNLMIDITVKSFKMDSNEVLWSCIHLIGQIEE